MAEKKPGKAKPASDRRLTDSPDNLRALKEALQYPAPVIEPEEIPQDFVPSDSSILPSSGSGSYIPPPLTEGMVHLTVVGRTPAGLAAAIQTARRGYSVLLLDSDGHRQVGLSAHLLWASQAGFNSLLELKISDKLGWQGPAGVHFISPNLNKFVTLQKPPVVRMISTDLLLTALETSALAAGAKRQKSAVARISLKDSAVQVQLSGGQVVTSQLLIYADDTIAKPLLDAAHLQTPLMSVKPGWSLYRLTHAEKNSRGANLAIIIGWRGSSQLGSAWTDGSTGVLVLPEANLSPPEAVAKLISDMIAHHILPPGTTLTPPGAERRAFAPGSSLEFEQHFGKRCVLTGQCGGFSAALSGEALYAGLRSGMLAGGVCVRALQSRVTQDVLCQFDTQWRSTLADYLRLPNTDLSFILPVVFTNPQMASKIAAGFINGENL